MLPYKININQYITEYFNYIIIVFILCVVAFFLYFKGKHKFWLNQSIHNKYNFKYFGKNGLINNNAPHTKYYNPLIYSNTYSNLETEKKELIVSFVAKNYRFYKDLVIKLDTKKFTSLFEKHNDRCYISLFYKNHKINNKLLGCICSRPLEGRFHNKQLKLYSLDYLCNKDKKSIYFELLYTHFKRSIEQKNVKIFMFRSLTPIEISHSLVQYKSFLYSIYNYPIKIHSNCKNVTFISLNSSNFRLFMNTFYKLYKEFDCFLHINITQLMYLCDQKTLFITLIMFGNVPKACYFFKNTFSLYNNKNVLTCIGSYKTNIKNELFLEGYYNSLLIIQEMFPFQWVCIDDVNNNTLLIDLLKMNKILETYENYYYLYNFIYDSFKKDKVLLLL